MTRLTELPTLTDPLRREVEEEEDGVLRVSPDDLTFPSVPH